MQVQQEEQESILHVQQEEQESILHVQQEQESQEQEGEDSTAIADHLPIAAAQVQCLIFGETGWISPSNTIFIFSLKRAKLNFCHL